MNLANLDYKALLKDHLAFCLKRDMPLWMQIKWYEAQSSDDPWYGLYRDVAKELRKHESGQR